MDLHQLDMFRAVAEERTFTRAAERLHVSQSAVSRQVQLLEEELGGSLLIRGGRGVTLTSAGELILELAQRLRRDVEEARSRLTQSQTLARGSLHLAGGMTVCMYVFPHLLKSFRRLYPGVDLRVTPGTAESVLRLLRGREVDLGLLTLPILARDLEVIPVLREEMVVVTAPRHPLSRERSVDPRRLGRFPLILYESGSNTRKVLDEFFLEQHIPVEVAMETENVEIIKAMVATGLGITIVPYTPVAKDVRSGRFAYVRLRGRRLYRETGWVFLKADPPPRVISEMLRVGESLKGQLGLKPPRS